MTSPDWFTPVPIDDFEALHKKQVEDPVPEECPETPAIEGLEVHCGPILKLCGTLENGLDNYRASIMLVVKGAVPKITYQIGPVVEGPGKVSDGEFPGKVYYELSGGLQFYRFNIALKLAEYQQKVRYNINGLFNPAHQFFLPAALESMNVVSYSCNGFSLATDTSDYQLSLWLDVLRKHSSQNYHVMLGGGDQIYCDLIKVHCKGLEPWLNLESSSKKREVEVTPDLLEEFEHYYLNAYLQWFGKGWWKGKNGATLQTMFPLAMAQIPTVSIYDDHDIIDGFGSYKDKTMGQNVFSTIGNVAYKYYMLFQHQILIDEPEYLEDPLWVLSKGNGPWIKQPSHSVFMRLGQEISLVGIDCRTERKLSQVVSNSTYKIIFSRLQAEIDKAPETKHLLVMLGVPIMYPRLVWLELILNSTVLKPVKKLATKGIISKGLVNEFDGSVEVLDDLNDHWCSKHHKRERNFLLKSLTEFGAKNGVRITILSGDVHLCCFGRFKTKIHHHPHAHLLQGHEAIEEKNKDVTLHPETDPRLVFNVISSAIVNAPPPDPMATLLGKRSKVHHYDLYTDEDILPIFSCNPDGSQRDNNSFLNKRNWNDLVLAKQSVTYKGRAEEWKFPGPLVEEYATKMAKNEISASYIKYPLLPDSLVTTIWVEKDGNDVKASTTGYEVLIPNLEGKYELEQTKIKHL
ncbi:CIC11C00000002220 [Sungouiella intermedia]|uniref:CIC11C00000002220 n=1 Tax=Sungouiella intermedia TaxID=45354 RepID=A0A1L0BFV9_9ASCO|nr:CIC11C00000002220 [[Candida] intermedia]